MDVVFRKLLSSILLLVLLQLATGCQSTGSDEDRFKSTLSDAAGGRPTGQDLTQQSVRRPAATVAGASDMSASSDPNDPVILTQRRTLATVLQVQGHLEFVVLDTGLNGIPEPGTHLVVYREDQPIGEVRVGRLIRGTTVVADLISGKPQVGDEVRIKTESSPRIPVVEETNESLRNSGETLDLDLLDALE